MVGSQVLRVEGGRLSSRRMPVEDFVAEPAYSGGSRALIPAHSVH